MRFIPEVDIPEPLLEAQDENKLVVFAGAGVSMPPPSNLPDFNKLAEMAEKRFGIERQKGDLTGKPPEQIDEYFGRLEKEGHPIHEYVAKIVGDSRSRPNDLHKNLIRLFNRDQKLRIVTTNYDTHLSIVAKEFMSEKPEEFFAPALPPGDSEDFVGIVYIHGNVNKASRKLVITKEDFGKAYLHKGWAIRFLKEMFREHTVLFIGYSLGDLIMQYLIQSLPRTTALYALTKEEGRQKWSDHFVQPITYPLLDNNQPHLRLHQTLQEWADYSQLGENEKSRYREAKVHVPRAPVEKVSFLGEEKRISAIVNKVPPENERDANYIESILKELPRTRFFVRNATNPAWLGWLNERGILKPLFDPACKLAETDSMLANWICATFIGENPDPVFELYHRNGQQLNPEFWRKIVWQLTYSEDRPEPQLLARWISLLLKDVPSDAYRYNSLDYLLSKCRYPEDKYTALLLLDYLLSPMVQTEPSFAMIFDKPEGGSRVDVSLKLRGEHIYLKESWEKIFRHNLSELWRVVLPIVQSYLTMANQINMAIGRAAGDEDYDTWWRSAIEPHEQDRNPRSFDALIDAARDILEYALENYPEDGKCLTESWFHSAVPILRRIAIHGISAGPCWTPDEKIMWLLDRDLIFRHWFKHEVFQVIRVAFPECSKAVQRKLITRVERGYEY